MGWVGDGAAETRNTRRNSAIRGNDPTTLPKGRGVDPLSFMYFYVQLNSL